MKGCKSVSHGNNWNEVMWFKNHNIFSLSFLRLLDVFEARSLTVSAVSAVIPSVSQCLVLGAGPCGLRAAIELSLLGAQVVVLEKRETFSRNNVLHLWPYTICDLRGLGAKKFYGKFCSGSLDHISESLEALSLYNLYITTWVIVD